MKQERFIIKRNGKRESYSKSKMARGVAAAFKSINAPSDKIMSLVQSAMNTFIMEWDALGCNCITAETAQQYMVKALAEVHPNWGPKARECFMTYANNRRDSRDMKALQETLTKLSTESAKDMDLKRENANIDADTAMGTMLKYGSESAKSIALSKLMSEDIATAHREGNIHIHDLDFWNLTETCCQINLTKLFKGGFSTGHGVLREPGGIGSAASLACIAIQSNQNDQHGGQSIPCFDFYMAPYVAKTMTKIVLNQLADELDNLNCRNSMELIREYKQRISDICAKGLSLFNCTDWEAFSSALEGVIERAKLLKIFSRSQKYTNQATYQAMEALVHNLNTMNSRAGAQVPFSSINFGTDTSPEGRCVSYHLMKAIYDGLGNGEV